MFDYVFVFIAGLITALATGIGAIPLFYTGTISSRQKVGLWGVASGIMVAASVFGLFREAWLEYSVLPIIMGGVVGGILVYTSSELLDHLSVNPTDLPNADFDQLLLILGVLTVHSFPEGVAVGVSFAELGLDGGLSLLGMSVPWLAVTMTVAISIHNIPEGLAVSIPLRNLGVSRWSLVGWSVFTSLPQPVGAVLAFGLVQYAESFLPYGFGFAGGAMIYLVFTEFFPEAVEEGTELAEGPWPALLGSFVVAGAAMTGFLLA